MLHSSPSRTTRAIVLGLAAFGTLIVPTVATAQTKTVTCALPRVLPNKERLCSGFHRVVYETQGFGADAVVTAELVGLGPNGTFLGALDVASGDLALLTTSVLPAEIVINTRPRFHELTAAVPLLRVTVADATDTATAYCSTIPYVDVVSPDAAVVTEANGHSVELVAAIPLIDPSQVRVRLDGVDILPALGITDPTQCTAGAPCGGVANVDGHQVTISDLVVDATTHPGALASNTVRMKTQHLGCGGHAFTVDGPDLPGAGYLLKNFKCFDDDGLDSGIASSFAVSIEQPLDGAAGVSVPTLVSGEVCHGGPIASVNVNGMPVNLVDPTVVEGDGTTSGSTYTARFETALSETDLALDLQTGDAPLGTFDRGTNRVIATATDTSGNRTFATALFATGPTANPGVSASAAFQADSLRVPLHEAAAYQVMGQIRNAMNGTMTEVDNAFVVGLGPDAIRKHFEQRCSDPVNGPGPQFANAVVQNIFDMQAARPGGVLDTTSISFDCSCDPDVTVRISNVSVNANDTSCGVTFMQDRLNVNIDLPDVVITVTARGDCEDEVLGVCVAASDVDITATTRISNLSVNFDIDEGQFLGGTTSNPVFVDGTTTTNTSGGTDTSCIGATVCDGLVTGLVEIFTFGQADIDLTPSLDITNVADFQQQVGASEPDPISLGELTIDEEEVENFDQTLSGALSSVSITPNGLVAGLRGSFATNLVDLTMPDTPGATLTPAPLPTLPVAGANDIFVALADDTLNMMFASMTMAGRLKTQCEASGQTVGDLFPTDCESILLEAGPEATAVAQGICHALRGDHCDDEVPGQSPLLHAIEQGACHGMRGHNCSTIEVEPDFSLAIAKRRTCLSTPALNLAPSMPLLFCSRQDIPPRMLLVDDPATAASESALRLNDLSVAMIVDRENNGLNTTLVDTVNCFAPGVDRSGDCNLFAACLDLNFNFNLAFQTCSDGKPGFATQFQNVQILSRQAGVVCGGASMTGAEDAAVESAATNEVVTIELANRADQFSPPICTEGLTLGGRIDCVNPGLVTLETDGQAAFRDYVGVTCEATSLTP